METAPKLLTVQTQKNTHQPTETGINRGSVVSADPGPGLGGSDRNRRQDAVDVPLRDAPSVGAEEHIQALRSKGEMLNAFTTGHRFRNGRAYRR